MEEAKLEKLRKYFASEDRPSNRSVSDDVGCTEAIVGYYFKKWRTEAEKMANNGTISSTSLPPGIRMQIVDSEIHVSARLTNTKDVIKLLNLIVGGASIFDDGAVIAFEDGVARHVTIAQEDGEGQDEPLQITHRQ